MPYKDKRQRQEHATQYSAEHYYSFQLKMQQNDADMIRRAAKIYRQSNSQFVLTCVREKLLRDGVDPNAAAAEQTPVAEDNAENQR